jgi:hypothetical protein
MDTLMHAPVSVSSAQTSVQTYLKFVGSNYVFVNATQSFSSGYFVAFSRTVVIQSYGGVVVGEPAPVSEGIEIRLNSGVYQWRSIKRNAHIWRNIPILTVSGVDYGIIKLSNGRIYIASAVELIDIPLSDHV